MTAQVFIYGKGKQYQYGIEHIAPALRPFQQELTALSAYHGTGSQDKSIRYGRLRNGSPYLSLAFSLPDGRQVDPRGQIRVFTFVFDPKEGCPLSRALLTALPSLTAEALDARATQDTIPLETLLDLGRQAPPLPPPARDFSLALLSALFFQADKGKPLTLLAQASPQELLAAIASLPAFLWPYLTFNTDVCQLSEPLALLNAWTPKAKQKAERSNYTGAAADCLRVFYPAEDGVLLHVGGLEQEARHFLALSEEEQEALFREGNGDLSQLLPLLRRPPEPPKAPTRIPGKGKRVAPANRRPCLPEDLRLSLLLAAAGLLALSFLCRYLPAVHQSLRLELHGDTLFFLLTVVLSWAILSGAARLAQGTIHQILFNLEYHRQPHTRARIARLRRLLTGLSCFLIPALLWIAGAGQVHLGSAPHAATLVLHLGGSPLRLLAGVLLGLLLWGLRAIAALDSACCRRRAPS